MPTIKDIPPVDVISVRPLEGYRLAVTFENGKSGTFDMRPYLYKGVFRALQDPSVFRAVRVEGGTATWPGDIDIAPERLYTDCAADREV